MATKGFESNSPTDREITAAVRAGMAYVERGDYRQGYATLHAAYVRNDQSLPSAALSHFGVSVAVVENQTRKGEELCRRAIEEQFFNGAHVVNLVRLYVIRGDRKAAYDELQKGLARLPNDRMLLRVREELGRREPPVLPFLRRSNPINVALGRIRANRKRALAEQKRAG
ncbi:MAG: hypothetical protein ACSLFQ_20730 [Thermoanaerobaculia bacterium]